jgi:hypothetical protein
LINPPPCDLCEAWDGTKCAGTCDRDGDGIADSGCLCASKGDGKLDSCWLCSRTPGGPKDACNQCDTNCDGKLDSCYFCDDDADGINDSCGKPIANWTEYQNCPKRVKNCAYRNPVTSPACSVPFNLPGADNPAGCAHTSFAGLCGYHDQCYGTCNTPRATCDWNFKNGLDQVCNDALFWDGAICWSLCSAAATIYSGFVFTGGETAYENRQIQACLCCK